MSVQTLKTENDFCNICLRTRAEVKLDPVSTKIYQMFFVGLVKCVESNKLSRNICVWCHRRVVNALKLVETAQTTDRILTNITQTDNLQCQSFKQTVWDQIQTTKRTYDLNPRNSQVICYSLPSNTGAILPVKFECEDGISHKEKSLCLDNIINNSELDQIQDVKSTSILNSRTSRVTSYNLSPEAGIELSVKLEHEDGIANEDENIHLNRIISKVELNQIPASNETHIVTSRILDRNVKLEHEDGSFGEEGNICLDRVLCQDRCFPPHQNAVYCKGDLNQMEAANKTHIVTSMTPQVVSCNMPPDMAIGLSRKFEHEEEIACWDDVIKDEELENKDLEKQDFLELKLESKIDNHLTSELDITEETPCLNEVRESNKYKSNVVMKKTIKEMDSHKTVYIEISNLEPINTDGNQNSVSEVINKNPGERDSKNVSQGGNSDVEVEDLDTNSQTTYSLEDAHKHIQMLKLTESQRLQELEERRQKTRYCKASFKCEPCALAFTFRKSYETHMAQHSEGFGSHKCSICSLHFEKMNSYYHHQKSHYIRYECVVCGCNYLRRQNAIDHYLAQHTNEQYKCEHCTDKFRRTSLLMLHMKTVHDVERPHFPCQHCSRVFNTKQSYHWHMKRHDKSLLRPHQCGVCSRTFKIAYYLRQHQATHSKENKFLCQLCGTGLKSLKTFNIHMNRKHSDVCFECDYCQKTFTTKGNLTQHITWMHLGRGYQCQLCTKVLRFKRQLKRHIKEKHETQAEQKENVCEVCGKVFSRSRALKIHRRVHSTEHYRCTACSVTFKYCRALESHKQRVHKINDYMRCSH